nr:hypothetical protein [Mycobacterium riyadhense]
MNKPEELPEPVLKNPDDGPLVEFPNPGAAGISMIWTLMGPAPLLTEISIAVEGPPMLALTVGRVPVMVGMVMELRVALPVNVPETSRVISGMVKLLRLMLPRLRLMGMLRGMLTSKFNNGNSGILSVYSKPIRP